MPGASSGAASGRRGRAARWPAFLALLAVLFVACAAPASSGGIAPFPVVAPRPVGDLSEERLAEERAGMPEERARVPVGGMPGARSVWIWSDPDRRADPAQVVRRLAELGLEHHALRHLGFVTFVADGETARRVAAESGGRVEPDARLQTHLDKSVPYIGADRVKAAVGERRDGPTVLVVDTGVDSLHPDFRSGNLAANAQPVRQGALVVGSADSLPVVDMAGHGTHVAGIVAGSGASLGSGDPLRGRYVGVYSNGRVASYQAGSSESDEAGAKIQVVAALEAYDWALANREELDLRVVSNSWGTSGGFDPGSAIHQATLRLYLAGLVVLFSAGNDGEDGPGTLNRYCVAPWVLCVAAGDLGGERTGFSSRGSGDPALPYDHPDLTAPGQLIHAPVPTQGAFGGAAGGLLAAQPASESFYDDKSGTSMAVPHVAGAAAQLLAVRPDLSPDEVMDLLVATARPMPGGTSLVGAGYLDVAAAYTAAAGAPGNRAAFLAGREVKYAGPASGDPQYAADPVSVGYAGLVGPALALDRPTDRLWLAMPLAWVLLGGAAVAVLAGTRWRRTAG